MLNGHLTRLVPQVRRRSYKLTAGYCVCSHDVTSEWFERIDAGFAKRGRLLAIKKKDRAPCISSYCRQQLGVHIMRCDGWALLASRFPSIHGALLCRPHCRLFRRRTVFKSANVCRSFCKCTTSAIEVIYSQGPSWWNNRREDYSCSADLIDEGSTGSAESTDLSHRTL